MNSSIKEHEGKGAEGVGSGGGVRCLCSLTAGVINAETEGLVVWLVVGFKDGVGT
jgi:hypothetical protein